MTTQESGGLETKGNAVSAAREMAERAPMNEEVAEVLVDSEGEQELVGRPGRKPRKVAAYVIAPRHRTSIKKGAIPKSDLPPRLRTWPELEEALDLKGAAQRRAAKEALAAALPAAETETSAAENTHARTAQPEDAGVATDTTTAPAAANNSREQAAAALPPWMSPQEWNEFASRVKAAAEALAKRPATTAESGEALLARYKADIKGEPSRVQREVIRLAESFYGEQAFIAAVEQDLLKVGVKAKVKLFDRPGRGRRA